MKKKILSFVLATIMIFSNVPYAYAVSSDSTAGTKENPNIINNHEEFMTFLENADNSGDVIYYELGADIVADSSDPVGGYDAANIQLDGNGYSIGGYQIENALFSSMENSAVRNVVFDNATVTDGYTRGTRYMAAIAEEINDNTFISNVVFNDCTVVLPADATVYAAFAVADNDSNITNIIVENTCKIITESGEDISDAEYFIGGVASLNSRNGSILNCISEMQYSIPAETVYTLGGVVAENRSLISHCHSAVDFSENAETFGYVYAVLDGDSYVTHTSHVDGSKFIVENAITEKDYSSMDVYEYAAEMSESVMNNYNSTLYLTRESDDLAALWAVDGSQLSLSFDGLTAQVYVVLDDELKDIKHGSLKDVDVEFSDSNVRTIIQDKKYSVCVGSYNGGKYTRNTMTLSAVTDDYKMVRSFVCRPMQSYVKTMQNTIDGTSGTYADMYLDTAREYTLSGVTSKATAYIYPFGMTVSVSNISSYDEIVDLQFSGSGTETDPFLITHGYEMFALSHYVNTGKTYGSLRYNEASYELVNNISLGSDNFTPIGSYSNDGSTYFKGTFEGNGHIVSNFVSASTDMYRGLFGIVEGVQTDDGYKKAVIRGINIVCGDIVDEDLNNYSNIKGILAGQVNHAYIEGCVAEGTVTGGTFIGGLIGYAANSEIVNCGTAGDVHSYHQSAWVGGIVGLADNCTIINSYSAATVYCNNVAEYEFLNAGHIAGKAKNVTYEHNYAVEGEEYFTDSNNISGLEFKLPEEMTEEAFAIEISEYSEKNGYVSTFSTSTSGYKTPLSAYSENSKYSVTCVMTSNGQFEYSDSSLSHLFKAGEKVELLNKTKDDITGVLFRDIHGDEVEIDYSLDENYITFIMPDFSVSVMPTFYKTFLQGAGTQECPFIIASYQDLVNMATQINDNPADSGYADAYYEVINDIDCDMKDIPLISYSADDSDFEHSFTGSFDGNGHTISNGTLPSVNGGVGMFYSVSGAVIRDICFSDIYTDFIENDDYLTASALIARRVLDGDSSTDFINITVEGCVIQPLFTHKKSDASLGILAGTAKGKVQIINCLFKSNFVSMLFSTSTTQKDDTGHLIGVVSPLNVDLTVENIIIMGGNDNALIGTTTYYSSYSSAKNIYFECAEDDMEMTVINDSTYIYRRADGIDENEITTTDVAMHMASYALTELNDYNAAAWQSIKNETDIILAVSADAKACLPVSYDDIFSDSEIKSIITASAPTMGIIGSTVEIPYYLNADISTVLIEANGKKISYTVDLTDREIGVGVIKFIMPASPVTVSNSDQEINSVYFEGIGTEDDPYVLKKNVHLLVVADVINGHSYQVKPTDEYVDYDKAYYILANDIDMLGVNWEGIGISSVDFSGTIDGQGNAINYLNKSTSGINGEKRGLFIELASSAVIENLHVNYAEVTGSASSGAGVIAKINRGRIHKCSFNSVSVLSDGLENVAAVAGKNTVGGIIENCAVLNSSVKDSDEQKYGAYLTYENQGSVANCIIYNCRWYNSDIDIAVETGIAPERVYQNIVNSQLDTDTYTVYKNDTAFQSGEVTYLLNNENTASEPIWRQNLKGSTPTDKYPVLDNTHYVVSKQGEEYVNVRSVTASRYVIMGDTDDNEIVNMQDLDLLERYFKRISAIKLRGVAASDLNGDGCIDESDYYLLYDYVAFGKGADEYNIGKKMPINYSMTDNSVMLGDLDNNLEIGQNDYDVFVNHLKNGTVPEGNDYYLADIDFDGDVDAYDAELIYIYLRIAETENVYYGNVGKVAYIGEEIIIEKPSTPEIPDDNGDAPESGKSDEDVTDKPDDGNSDITDDESESSLPSDDNREDTTDNEKPVVPDSIPQTGDDVTFVLPAAVMFISLIVLMIMIHIRKKKETM